MPDTPFLLARVHLPEDRTTSFIYQCFGDNVGAMDGSVFSFHRAGELVNAYAWWETHDPEVIGRGGHGVIRIVPMTPDLWTHLKPGTSLAGAVLRITGSGNRTPDPSILRPAHSHPLAPLGHKEQVFMADVV